MQGRQTQLALILVMVVLAGVPGKAQSLPDPVELIRKAAQNDEANEKKAHDYIFIQRSELHKHGKQDKPEITTREVFVLYGEEVTRLIERDDKPLPEKDARKEEERIAKIVRKRESESPEERRKREEKYDKQREEGRKFVQEIADAFGFRLLGLEDVRGRPAWLIAGEPKPGYKPKLKNAGLLRHFRFKAWIDLQDVQLSRLEAEAIDNVSFGLLLARLGKGATVLLEQTRVNDEVWLPQHVAASVGARIMLMKKYDVDLDMTFRDYRKFRANSRILGIAGPQS